MSAAPSPPFPDVPERIAEIILVLCQTVSMRLRTPTAVQAQLTYIVGRLLGIRGRFQRLVARIRAGQAPRERVPAPRAAPAPDFPLGFRPPPPGWRRWAMPADRLVPLWRSLRQTFAWVLRIAPMVPEFRDSAAGQRERLLAVLAEPETRALLLVSRRVGDSLRPLCWMLGIESSVLYPARPVAGAAVVSVVDAVSVDAVTSVLAGDNPAPDPVTDETAFSDVATPIVATSEPMMPGVIEPPTVRPRPREGGDIFATA